MLERGAAANREFAFYEHAIHVEARAIAAEAVVARADLGAALGEIGGGTHGVHRAGGVADAEDIGIGPATQLNRVDLKHINRRAPARLEITKRHIRVADTANAVGGEWIVLGVVGCRSVAVEGKIGKGWDILIKETEDSFIICLICSKYDELETYGGKQIIVRSFSKRRFF